MPSSRELYPQRFITFGARSSFRPPELQEGDASYQFAASVDVPAPTAPTGTLRILVVFQPERRRTKLSLWRVRLGLAITLLGLSPLIRASASEEEDDDSKTGFSAAVNQWRAGSSRPRYRLEGYDLQADSVSHHSLVKDPRGNSNSLAFAKMITKLQLGDGDGGELEGDYRAAYLPRSMQA
jgi:hypothetical protein